MIVFKDILIQGFGSIVNPLEYQLDNPGINMIQGKNGSGKTTIFSALTWCLYGQTLKVKSEVTPWLHVIPLEKGKDFEGTKVEVRLKVGLEDIKIVRCNEYLPKVEGAKGKNRILLYINGTYQEQLRDKRDVQAKIESILGMSFNLFKNALVFGQKLTRLLAESGESQKKLFDEAFEASFINQARERAKVDLATIKADHHKISTEHEAEFSRHKTWVSSIKRSKELWQTQQDERIKEINKQISGSEEEIKNARADKEAWTKLQTEESEIKNRIEGLGKKIEKLKKISDKHFRVDFKLEQDKAELAGFKKRLIDITLQLSSKELICRTCGNPINAVKKAEIDAGLKKEHKELIDKSNSTRTIIKEAEAELIRLTSSIKKYDKRRELYTNLNKELAELQNMGYDSVAYRPGLIKKYVAKVEEHKQTLIKLQGEKPKLGDFIKKKREAKNKVIELKPQLKELNKKLSVYKWLIEDPLSSKGLRAYIFNSMLGSVNDQLKQYAKYIGFNVVLSIDLESGHKNFQAEIYRKKKVVSYNDLSGGQQQLVDICLAFSIHDVVSATKPINILIMDELFESLDADNIELVSELLYLKSKNISTHLITHAQGMNSAKLANVLQLKNDSGLTSVA